MALQFITVYAISLNSSIYIRQLSKNMRIGKMLAIVAAVAMGVVTVGVVPALKSADALIVAN